MSKRDENRLIRELSHNQQISGHGEPIIMPSGWDLENKIHRDGHTYWRRNGEPMKPSERHG